MLRRLDRDADGSGAADAQAADGASDARATVFGTAPWAGAELTDTSASHSALFDRALGHDPRSGMRSLADGASDADETYGASDALTTNGASDAGLNNGASDAFHDNGDRLSYSQCRHSPPTRAWRF